VPPGASRWEEKSGLAAASRAAGAAMDSGFRGGTSHLGVGPLCDAMRSRPFNRQWINGALLATGPVPPYVPMTGPA
jgi:hypothetical protein